MKNCFEVSIPRDGSPILVTLTNVLLRNHNARLHILKASLCDPKRLPSLQLWLGALASEASPRVTAVKSAARWNGVCPGLLKNYEIIFVCPESFRLCLWAWWGWRAPFCLNMYFLHRKGKITLAPNDSCKENIDSWGQGWGSASQAIRNTECSGDQSCPPVFQSVIEHPAGLKWWASPPGAQPWAAQTQFLNPEESSQTQFYPRNRQPFRPSTEVQRSRGSGKF